MSKTIELPFSPQDVLDAASAPPPQSPEQALLLTVARILRARLPDMTPPGMDAYLADDMWALNEALKPFDPSNVVPLHPNTASE